MTHQSNRGNRESKITFEQLDLGGLDRDSEQKGGGFLVPILSGDSLAHYELPIAGSQIVNVLRNESLDISLEQARVLVSQLTSLLSPDPTGAAKLFSRCWQEFDPALNSNVEWLLNVASSLYNPDVVFECSLTPYRLLIDRDHSLSDRDMTAWLEKVGSQTSWSELLLRMAPGAGISFNKTLMDKYHLMIAMSESDPLLDWSFCRSVSVFRDLGDKSNYFMLSGREIAIDKDKSDWDSSTVFSMERTREGVDVRWETTISDERTDLKIQNTGNAPLKVAVVLGQYQAEPGKVVIRI